MAIKPATTTVDWWLNLAIVLAVTTFTLLGTFEAPNSNSPTSRSKLELENHKSSAHSFHATGCPSVSQLDRMDIKHLEERLRLLHHAITKVESDLAQMQSKEIELNSTYARITTSLSRLGHANSKEMVELMSARARVYAEKQVLQNAKKGMQQAKANLENMYLKKEADLAQYKQCMKDTQFYKKDGKIGARDLVWPNSTMERNKTRRVYQDTLYTEEMYDYALAIPLVVCAVSTAILMALVALRHFYHNIEWLVLHVYILTINIIIAILASLTIRYWLLYHNRCAIIILWCLVSFLTISTIAPIWLPPLIYRIKNLQMPEWCKKTQNLQMPGWCKNAGKKISEWWNSSTE